MKKLIAITTVIFWSFITQAQDYRRLIAEGTYKVEEIVRVAEKYFDSVGKGRGTGYKPFKRWQYLAEKMMDENGYLKSTGFYYNELKNYNARINSEGVSKRSTVGAWEDMGPDYYNATTGWNPGVGRITSLAIEEANPNHIIAGSPTGGIWKTLDGGQTWAVLTDNLANIDVYALAMDPTNSSIYYFGSTSGDIFKSSDAGATWSYLSSVSNGLVNKFLIHPNNPLEIYCSAQSGGIFKSLDGGLNWVRIHSEATTGFDIEFKPGDYNTIYATGSKFFSSTDGGQTFSTANGLNAWSQETTDGSTQWSTTGSNQNGSVTPRTGNAMALFYVGNYSSPSTRLISPALNLSGAINPQLKFSYTQVSWFNDQDELKVLYKTSANGNWIELAHYTSEVLNWADITINLPNTTSDYYIAFEGFANYGRGITIDDVSVETANNGVIFSDGFESAPNQFASGAKMIGVSPADPTVVYVVEENSGRFEGLHKSTNSGNTFTKISHTQNFFGYDSNGFDDRGQAPRDMDIVVHPNNINDVHIGGINTWRSTDGGTTFSITSQWTPSGASSQNIGYCHADIDIMQFVGSGAEATLFLGTDGGVFKTPNALVVNSRYYRDLSTGMGIRQFYKMGISQTDPVIVTAGSQDNGTSVLNNDGLWTDWLGADGMEGFVDKNNPDVIYGTTQFGGLYKSINNGVNAFGLTIPVGDGNWNWIVPFEQDPVIQDKIYAAYKTVYQSLDGGVNWTAISQNFGSNIDHFKVAPTNNDKMYLAINGSFWYTTNGGAFWVQSGLNLNGGFINEIAVHPTNANKIAIATTDSNKVYLSTDGGLNFSPIRWDLPNFSALSLAWQENNQDGLYVGMNYGVYYTDNTLGEAWVPFNNGLPNVRIFELEINTTENKLYAATYGRGLWRTNLYNESLSTSELELTDLQLYPNPTKANLNLKWNRTEKVELRIYNALGKLMIYKRNLELLKGFTLNVSDLTSGVYFVKLNSSQGEITKKLIIN